jgi:hypothetical protein
MPTAVPITAPQGRRAAAELVLTSDLGAILRPFLLIGVVFFVIGFLGYLAFAGGSAAAPDGAQGRPEAMTVTAPATDLANPPQPV